MAALLLPALLLATMWLTGCSGDDSTDQSSADIPSAGSDSVAGEYDTTVTLLNSTCADIVVQDNPTTVDQESGSDTIELTHAGTTYTAELADDGQFTTDAVNVEVGPATHSLTVHGTFSGAGFRASVLATVTGGADGPCDYEVAWVGTRQQ